MTNSDGQRRTRLADFESRARADRSSVHRIVGLGRYVAVHPMSDEPSLLRRLGREPSECRVVDCYWSVGDDVYFVQILARDSEPYRNPGIYGRRSAGAGYAVNFIAVIDAEAVSRSVLEGCLRRIGDLIAAELDLGDSLTRLD